MPPPPRIGGIAFCFFGISATTASVVMRSPATEEAPCSAWRRVAARQHVFLDRGGTTCVASRLKLYTTKDCGTHFHLDIASVWYATCVCGVVDAEIFRALRSGPVGLPGVDRFRAGPSYDQN